MLQGSKEFAMSLLSSEEVLDGLLTEWLQEFDQIISADRRKVALLVDNCQGAGEREHKCCMLCKLVSMKVPP